MRRLLFLSLLLPAIALADERADLLAARDAFRAGNSAKLEQLAERLARSPLEPYLSYYRLRLNLEGRDPSSIQAYLARPADTPLIDKLRGEWLRVLGKRQQWAAFEAEYPRLQTPDAELACYDLQARGVSETLQAEIRTLWLVGKEQPESCAPVFEAALSRNLLNEDDRWQRLKLALENGSLALAKRLNAGLPPARILPVAELDAAAANPERYLDALNSESIHPVQRSVATFALLRLAKQSPALAAARWQKIAAAFPEAEQHYFYGWLGFEAARRLDPAALGWYQQAADAPLSELQLEWRVRAALRAQNWREVANGVRMMPAKQQRVGAWRYWLARALKAQGKQAEAQKLLTELSGEYNFYGQLAAEEIGAPAAGAASANVAYQPDKAELKRIQSLPGIQRALILYQADLRSEAAKEWAWAIRQFDDKQLLTAAEIARRNEMYDRAISAADRTVAQHDFNLRYLAPYREDLQPHLRDNGLEEAWVYGLMRQESRFVTQAKSNVGAAGLMQIMPATAQWVARKMGLASYKQSLIHQMDTNLKLGTYYMKSVLGWFDGSPVLASAAYNAGPGRARRWRGNTPLEGAIYAETIPFDETRDYVKKVMSNTVYYAALFGQPSQPLKVRLGVIAAKNPANQTAISDEK